MLFNSIQFALFFIIVYSLYLVLDHKRQNITLLIASYIFYCAWDPRFLTLIIISTLVDYYCGLAIYESKKQKQRKGLLFFSIFVNILLLGIFKYFNFFAENLLQFLNLLGFRIKFSHLNIILPVGISFYTFQTMSYTIDIYHNKLKPTRNLFDFALFVSFFPQLVAGPIERASHLLPQVLNPRKLSIEQFKEGCFLISWGLFLKVFVADNLAIMIVDPFFNSPPPYAAINSLLAIYAFAFQIFCDFAGYSEIARGLGKCMGFDIIVNFKVPYIATNPVEFWHRWHISLSTWLRDYLYIPLGGNRKGELITYRNLFITMLLGGLWHGAAWTFILWGIYHGLLLIIYRLIKPWLVLLPEIKNKILNKLWLLIRVIFFFHLVCFGWLIFRAQSVQQVIAILQRQIPSYKGVLPLILTVKIFIFYIAILLIIQFFQVKKDDLLVVLRWPAALRVMIYVMIFYSIVIFGVNDAQSFIYFQF